MAFLRNTRFDLLEAGHISENLHSGGNRRKVSDVEWGKLITCFNQYGVLSTDSTTSVLRFAPTPYHGLLAERFTKQPIQGQEGQQLACIHVTNKSCFRKHLGPKEGRCMKTGQFLIRCLRVLIARLVSSNFTHLTALVD
jgi:hypothetical protein